MSLGAMVRGWFGGGRRNAAPPPPGPADLSADARTRFWSRIGAVEPDVLGHFLSPGVTGGPQWPTTRQAYRVVRRASGAVLLATDGLSDPFDDERPGNGHGLELFLECADLPPALAGSPGEVTPIRESWMYILLSHIAGIVAANEGFLTILDHHDGLLSLELPGVSEARTLLTQLPDQYVTADDVLGVLVGGPMPDFPVAIEDMPLSPVRAVPIVLLTAGELAEIRAGDETTRRALARALASLPHTRLDREPLV